MNDQMLRDLLARLQRAEDMAMRYRQGVVSAISPLAVKVGGSATAYTGVKAVHGASLLKVGDVVAVATFGNDLLVLGKIDGGDYGAILDTHNVVGPTGTGTTQTLTNGAAYADITGLSISYTPAVDVWYEIHASVLFEAVSATWTYAIMRAVCSPLPANVPSTSDQAQVYGATHNAGVVDLTLNQTLLWQLAAGTAYTIKAQGQAVNADQKVYRNQIHNTHLHGKAWAR